MEREVVEFGDYETAIDFYDSLYLKNSTCEFNDHTYTHVDKVDKSMYSDGESCDFIYERCDGKFFKLEWWEGGYDGCVIGNGNNNMKEVFQKIIQKTIYE